VRGTPGDDARQRARILAFHARPVCARIDLLLLFVGTAFLGVALRRQANLRAAAALLVLWLPSAALIAGANTVTGLHAPPLSIAVALCGLGFAVYGYHHRK